MKALHFVIPLIAVLFAGTVLLPGAFAQFQSGGVDKDGEWYPGEGLKHGDYFSYRMCHVDYKECSPFRMDFWMAGDTQDGSEEKWLVEAVVYDGSKIVKGTMELGKLAPEPTGGSDELGLYRGAFKSSVVWLSAFATEFGTGDEGPKAFRDVSWGKIANIGGEQIIPTDIETVTVPAGTWEETVLITWKTGGVKSQVWIADEFPFPIKAATFTHVSEGIPPPEYDFMLLDYKENVQESPFTHVVSTLDEQALKGCQKNFEKVNVKKPTKNFQYQVHVFYGPEYPVQGCEMNWLIKFISKFDDTEFLNQVQYDLLVVDDDFNVLRSIADDEGRKFLYSPSGQALVDFVVKEDPGTAHYVVVIYGLAPQFVVPDTKADFLQIDLPISASNEDNKNNEDSTGGTAHIPSWVKNNAGWWADGVIDDNSFIQGIQYLIREGIMKIPPTVQGATSDSNEIPSWVKNNAGWWADGVIDDNSFIQGLQFLIKEGIIKFPTSSGN